MGIFVSTLLDLAQAYGAGTYDSCTYGGKCTGTASTSGNGLLANTGLVVAIIITAACFIIFLALLVRFWRAKKA
jgi:hypothetical protein